MYIGMDYFHSVIVEIVRRSKISPFLFTEGFEVIDFEHEVRIEIIMHGEVADITGACLGIGGSKNINSSLVPKIVADLKGISEYARIEVDGVRNDMLSLKLKTIMSFPFGDTIDRKTIAERGDLDSDWELNIEIKDIEDLADGFIEVINNTKKEIIQMRDYLSQY
jgi:hypothetical protein